MVRNLILCLALLLTTVHPLRAKSETNDYENLPGWHWVAGGVLKSLSFPNASLGIAVGEGGLVIRTTDGGRSWQPIRSGVKTDLKHVSFVDHLHGWIVGNQGVILFSQDGGLSWNKQTSHTSTDLNRGFFQDLNRAWVVGNNGVILATTNGGVSWTQQTSGTTQNLYGIDFVDASYGWISGQNGLVLATVNGGSSWTKQTSCTETHDLYDVDFVNREVGWLVGMGGALWRTNDGGAHWTEWFMTDWTSDLHDIDMLSSDGGWIVGKGGFLAQYQNSSWTRKESGSEINLYGVEFFDASHGWFAGEAGSVFSTSDGGTQWERSIGSTTAMIRDIYFIDEQRGWAGVGWHTSGFPGAILATRDGGRTWNVQKSGITWANEIQFTTQYEGWAAIGSYESGQILHTQDGGIHWVSQLDTTSRPIRAIHFLTSAYGWAVGGAANGNGWIYATTNGGQTWSEQAYLYDQHNLLDVCFSDFQHGWAVGEYGTIYATQDGGAHWFAQTSGVSKALKSVYCYQKWVWAVGEDVILFTSDGGNTWDLQRDGHSTEFYNAVDFSGPAWGWVAGSDASTSETLVLASGDGGKSWIPEELPIDFGGPSAVHATGYGWGPLIWMGGGDGILLSNRQDGYIPVTTSITPAQEGDLFSKDGQVHLHFPAGLVNASTVITYTPLTAAQGPSTGNLSAWRLFDLTALEENTGSPPTLTPGTCYTLTIGYQGWLVQEDDQLALYHWKDNQWVKESSSQVDAQLDRVTACLDHFSYFALLGKQFRLYLPVLLR